MSFRVAFLAGATADDEFRNAIALSEFDGVFVDPERLRDPDASLLSRRREEIEILLSTGGVVVLFARPRIEIGSSVDNYSWLLNRPFEVVDRSGTSVRPERHNNAFRDYFRSYETDGRSSLLHFQVVLERVPDDLPGARVLATNKAGETIGLLYRELRGTIAILPPVVEIDDRFREIISDVIRSLKERRSSIELAPDWVRTLAPVPGEAERRREIEDLDEHIATLEAKRDEQISELEELRDLKALLWETGPLGLVPAVRAALVVLGFDVRERSDEENASAIRLTEEGGVMLCEVDASEGLVELGGFRRLHDAVTEELLERGTQAKGLLVGNGNRLQPIETSVPRRAFAANGLAGCEKFGYAAIPTVELYRATEAVLRRPEDTDLKQRIRQDIQGTAGEWRFSTPG